MPSYIYSVFRNFDTLIFIFIRYLLENSIHETDIFDNGFCKKNL